MRKIVFIIPLLIIGCTRPQVVVDAGQERDAVIRQFVSNTEVRENFLIDKLYQAETKTIDAKLHHEVVLIQNKYEQYLKENTDATGKIPLAKVIEGNESKVIAEEGEKLKAQRLKEKALRVRELLIAAGQKNKANLIIANKLTKVIAGFDGAELEAGLVAQEALKELKSILTTIKGDK